MGNCVCREESEEISKPVIQCKEDFVITSADLIGLNKQKFKDCYKLGRVLGQGALGEVRACESKVWSEQRRAVKIIKKEQMNSMQQKFFEAELSILRKLDHPNIMKIHEVFEDKINYYLVTELCQGVELFDTIQCKVQFSEYEAAEIIKQILQAISYCHKQGVVHRDLKPENIIYDESDKSLKIIDFGTSVEYNIEKDALKQVHGSSYYIAPEVLKKNYDERCDVWAVGVLLFILLSGAPPFDGEDNREILTNIESGRYAMDDSVWSQISEDCKELVHRMLTINYKQRPFAKDILSHPWFQDAPQASIDQDAYKKALSNMRNFNVSQKLQQATLCLMVNNIISTDERKRLEAIFRKLDINGDGLLQRDELLQGLTELYGEAVAQEECDKIFAAVDIDCSGELDLQEFMQACANKEALLDEKQLKNSFEFLDTDKSGYVTVEELNVALGIGKNVDQQVWLDVVNEVDVNGDGVIDFNEFKAMMRLLVR